MNIRDMKGYRLNSAHYKALAGKSGKARVAVKKSSTVVWLEMLITSAIFAIVIAGLTGNLWVK